MLSVHNLACERGGRELFSNLNFELHPGELLYIRGANGSGKTTLLRALCGLTLPSQGEIRWNGRAPSQQSEQFHQQLCYLGHRNGLYGDLTAIENLQADHALHAHTEHNTVNECLQQAGLAARIHVPVRHLSQGQQRRVALAKLLCRRSSLWILDEPFTALDTDAVNWLIEVIGQHLARKGMIVMTTHQDTAVSRHVTREVVLLVRAHA